MRGQASTDYIPGLCRQTFQEFSKEAGISAARAKHLDGSALTANSVSKNHPQSERRGSRPTALTMESLPVTCQVHLTLNITDCFTLFLTKKKMSSWRKLVL